MNFGYFVDGPLLWFVFLVFFVGVVVRVALFFYSVIKTNKWEDSGWWCIPVAFGRSLLPFHKGFVKRPIYATLHYVFHTCLFVVPIWYSGHIVLWDESRFGWGWAALSDIWVDWMTIVLLGLAAFFLIRHILSAKFRTKSSKSAYFLIFVTALPFLTGYFLAHGSLDHIVILGDSMSMIHTLSAEALLIVSVFLFYRVKLDIEKCTGCASCEINCTTGALQFEDGGDLRMFMFSPYRCFCCGECVKTCPEDAVSIGHRISNLNFSRAFFKEKLCELRMAKCTECGKPYKPIRQIQKVGQKVSDEYIHLCPRCKARRTVGNLFKVA